MSTSKRSIRVLHLASFAGNIGDVANHAGARRMFVEHLSLAFEFTNLEIREFYWRKRSFDNAFIEYANSYDLLIIGGGNYFELWVDNSATGTSIDISMKRLSQLKVPTIFFALGVDTGQGYSQQSAQRFTAFMMAIMERPNFFICVRNDGSKNALCEVLGEQFAALIPVIPDGGFFADSAEYQPIDCAGKRIGINIAGDMLERRFSRDLNAEGFLRELGAACCTLMDLNSELSIDLIPHIWRDNVMIAQLLSLIPDPYLRSRIAVGRLEPNEAGLPAFLQNYRSLDLVLGMRFHANVCPIGMGTPVRGLLNYPQVEKLFEEIGMSDRLVDVRNPGFGQQIIDGVLADFSSLPAQRQRCLESVIELRQKTSTVLAGVDVWLNQNFGA